LWAAIVWDDPPELKSAKIHYEHRPEAVRGRNQWATELARVGRVEEALRIREGLVTDYPNEPGWWSGILQLVSWYPDAADAPGIWQRALNNHPTGAMAAAVANAMADAGEEDTAKGMLELAWQTVPGERSLKRARRNHNLSIVLDGDVPWRLRWDPATGLARTEDPAAVDDQPRWTVAEARRVGAEVKEERTAVIEAAVRAIRHGEPEWQVPLAWFRDGTTDIDSQTNPSLRDDINSMIERDRVAGWMPPQIWEAIQQFGLPANVE
jgi:hypothetical protein